MTATKFCRKEYVAFGQKSDTLTSHCLLSTIRICISFIHLHMTLFWWRHQLRYRKCVIKM